MQPDGAETHRGDGTSPSGPAPEAAPVEPVSPFSRAGASTAYSGPPRMTAPPEGWQVPHLIEVPPPRRLPPQDHPTIDDEEARARTFTYGIGAVAAALILVVLCAVAGRWLF